MAGRKPAQLEFTLDNAPAQAAGRHRIKLDGRWIEYTLKRSRHRRSITITVDEAGLRVGAPWRAPQYRIESLLGSHARWISLKLVEWQARRPPPFAWKAGAAVMVLGEPLTLALDPARGAPERTGGLLYVAADARTESAAVAGQVVAWLRVFALRWFEQRVTHFVPALGVPVPVIRLSNAKTRWGNCHPEGRVLLNWRLIQMPPPLIDYVVVHELAHLLEPNHSQRFWRRVAGVLPDYNERRRALRRDGHRYLFA